MVTKESFGMERAYGNIYFARGGFSDREDYLLFVENQDVANASLREAFQYTNQLVMQGSMVGLSHYLCHVVVMCSGNLH